MMKHFIQIDPNGLVTKTMSVPDDYPDPEEPEWVLYTGDIKPMFLGDFIYLNGALTPKGILPDPVITTVGAEKHYSWTGLPTGTVIEVHDGQLFTLLGSEQEVGGAATVELVDAGTYYINVNPPVTYRGQQIEDVL